MPNLTLTLVSMEPSRRINKWHYRAVPTGATYASGGDVVDFTAATVKAGAGHAVPDYIPTKDQVSFESASLDFAQAVFVVGTTLKNAKIKVLASADTEISSYSAGQQASQINFTITQKRGISA